MAGKVGYFIYLESGRSVCNFCGSLLLRHQSTWAIAALVSSAKSAEPIKIMFGQQTRMGPGVYIGSTWRVWLNICSWQQCGLSLPLL